MTDMLKSSARKGIWVVSTPGNQVWVWLDELVQFLHRQKAKVSADKSAAKAGVSGPRDQIRPRKCEASLDP